jgi:hypothetical protein
MSGARINEPSLYNERGSPAKDWHSRFSLPLVLVLERQSPLSFVPVDHRKHHAALKHLSLEVGSMPFSQSVVSEARFGALPLGGIVGRKRTAKKHNTPLEVVIQSIISRTLAGHYLRVDRRDGVGLSLWSATAGTAHESSYLGAIFPLSSRLESNAVRGCVSTK